MDEQKLANSILKKILALPNATYLAHLMSISLQNVWNNHPDKIQLFNWLLTGDYIQGILTKYTENEYDIDSVTESVLEDILGSSISDPLIDQKIIEIVSQWEPHLVDHIIKISRAIVAKNNIAIWSLAKFFLTGKSGNKLYKDFIMNNEVNDQIIWEDLYGANG